MTMPKTANKNLSPTQKAFFEYIEKKKALQTYISEGKDLKEYSKKYGVKFYTPIPAKD